MKDKRSSQISGHPLFVFILVVLGLAVFGDLPFLPKGSILSRQGLDLSEQFIYWRDFASLQLRQGNFPLWNPLLFSGVPFFGGFQAALLYPPNAIYLILPLAQATNGSIIFHMVLLGLFMYLWAAARGLSPPSCLLAAAMVMFGGPYFLHIYAGHLSNLCAMSWIPLIFFAVERLCTRSSARWVLLGMFSFAMQILAGHPQYSYYTGLAAGTYGFLLLAGREDKLAAAFRLLLFFAGAAALGALQIAGGLHAASESVRAAGVSISFASMFSFPPENVLTWLTPWFFGDLENLPYWGRWYLWEMSLYISITGFALAWYGLLHRQDREDLLSFIMAILLMALALGAHTPLFSLLHAWLPGFDRFRGTSKFIFPATVFISLLSARGFHVLTARRLSVERFAFLLLVGSLVLATAGLAVSGAEGESAIARLWRLAIGGMSRRGESYLSPQVFSDESFLRQAAAFSAAGLVSAAAIALTLSLILYGIRRSRLSAPCIMMVALFELLSFALVSKTTFSAGEATTAELAGFYHSRPGDYRVMNLRAPNSAMSYGVSDIWGYDPGVPLRYAQFMAFTQGEEPDGATQYLQFTRVHPLFRMLRLRYVITHREGEMAIQEMARPLPRLQLVYRWRSIRDRKAILREMAQPTFDPGSTVILEGDPFPIPAGAASGGTVDLESASTDHLLITARLTAPAVLLVTDSYSSGWRARSLPGSAQETYHVLPANYTLMAIPLAQGAHRLILEYRPRAIVAGAWISLASVLCFGIACIFLWVRCPGERRTKGS